MNFISSLLSNLNYGTILFLMLLESTVVPVPSEFVVTPAAYHAASGNLDVFLVILFATIGADLGASVNYVVAYYVGRPVIYRFANSKWGKMCLLNQEKVEKSEKYFDDHGIVATLTGRLIPGIRHLISIPAGLAKMNYWKFLLYTTIGAGVWHSILAALGWYLHAIVPEDQLNDKITEYAEYIKIVIIGIVVIAIGYFVIRHFLKRKKQ
ncbi:MAG: DedA family protein [Prevotella sp.]|jgi:membrane protein DedA with SNARE-associated domain|nr:DedA family protein [Prevotella sp.]